MVSRSPTPSLAAAYPSFVSMKDAQINLHVLRHSTAHLMAAAIQQLWPEARFGVGPVVENGFYYDFEVSQRIEPSELEKIENEMRKLIKKGYIYEKQVTPLEEAITLFKKNGQLYKTELLKDLKKRGTTKLSKDEKEEFGTASPKNVSVYTTGHFTDLCLGPHVKTARDINPKAFKLTKIAGAYWRGKETNPMLTRIYGTVFRTEAELTTYLKLQEEIERRDHRKLGRDLDLFHFEDVAPGAPFWHPKGMSMIRELEAFWRSIHDKEGYQETSTPIMVKKNIFVQSGHWQFFKDDLFTLEVEKETYVLKPMNCPESTRIYSAHLRSYKDLPIRLSEIGRVHRNERSGVLMGLMRVRQITQDDAHIYARPDQIQTEIIHVLKLVKMFYEIFKLSPNFYLSTKPDKAMGDPALWEKAEEALAASLKENKLSYEIKPKDGAFYGPKIDIHITDSLARSWQIATIQLDFQMPERFDLSYIDEKGTKQRPVIIHRAIFGSFERFLAILLEHTAGALPLWLAPIQVKLIPVGAAHETYLKNAIKDLEAARIRYEISLENETVGKKIRSGELQKIPYLAVAGDKEMQNKTLRIRNTRKPKGEEDLGEITPGEFIKKIVGERDTKHAD